MKSPPVLRLFLCHSLCDNLCTACPWYNIACPMWHDRGQPAFCHFLLIPSEGRYSWAEWTSGNHSIGSGSSRAMSWNFQQWLSTVAPTFALWPKGKILKGNCFHELFFSFTQFPDPVHSTFAQAVVGCAAKIRPGTNIKRKEGIEHVTQDHHENLSWEINFECSHLLLRF